MRHSQSGAGKAGFGGRGKTGASSSALSSSREDGGNGGTGTPAAAKEQLPRAAALLQAIIHAANVFLLYTVFTLEWLFDLNGTTGASSSSGEKKNESEPPLRKRKRQVQRGTGAIANGPTAQDQQPHEAAKKVSVWSVLSDVRRRWSRFWLAFRRLLNLRWRFVEFDDTPQAQVTRLQRGMPRRTSVWLTLQTIPLPHAERSVQKGKERLNSKQHLINERRLVRAQVEDDSTLRMIEIDRLGWFRRVLLAASCVVPVLPEMVAAFAFFFASYVICMAYALTSHRKLGSYMLLGFAIFLHLPFLWVLWFPLLLISFFVMVLFHSLHSRLFLVRDAPRVFTWLTGRKEPLHSRDLYPPTSAKND